MMRSVDRGTKNISNLLDLCSNALEYLNFDINFIFTDVNLTIGSAIEYDTNYDRTYSIHKIDAWR